MEKDKIRHWMQRGRGRGGRSKMTVGAGICVEDGNLMVLGNEVLSDVHDNVVVTPASGGALTNGAFIGVQSDQIGSRRVFPIGKLDGLRFMCVFRFKLWWMTQRMGTSGQDVPFETQFLIAETKEGSDFGEGSKDGVDQSAVYTVFLPILEGDFRAVLQGNELNEIEICLESGAPAVDGFEGNHLVFVGAGSDPFGVITDSVKTVEKHLQTFSHRERKKMPDMLNWFGWCTWDAFYTDVTSEGLKQGLQSLEDGGVPPKFVIIDDGWQSVDMDSSGIGYEADNAANFANRLTNIKENHKFQKDGKEGHRVEDPALGLRHIVCLCVACYNWILGGVRPGVTEMKHYDSKLSYPISSPGIESNEHCDALKSITTNGLGLVNPEKVFNFYDELHSYLASAGIDGVKVDVQNILETLGAGHGGRVKLSRKYHQALEASIARNFPDNGIISCMSHNTDGLYSVKRTAVIRASDDFWPRDPASHTIHIASVAYNTVFLGEFMQPDWDMFHSLHPMAEYHGAARAVGGCAIYVSDKPGQHDFDLLKKLVLPDGSILRAKLPGRPTRIAYFLILPGMGKGSKNILPSSEDMESERFYWSCWGSSIARELGGVRRGVLSSQGCIHADNAKIPRWWCKICSHRPNQDVQFWGAIKEFESNTSTTVVLKVCGSGVFGAYASTRPKKITVDSEEVEFGYEDKSGLVSIALRVPEKELHLWNITIEF
ncbi:seed imbibition 1 [Prunus dulcis]|uniref:galactinol--sucrose galactosyltransferase n=1 Tax=Prunus dulcis TaxID=3755 RepID=A0A4Y1RLC4_PRUDU|nr:seed imbibition 1 [Prunus dulcis]